MHQSTLNKCHNLFIHSPILEKIISIHFLLVNNTTMNAFTYKCSCLHISVSLRFLPRSEIVWLCHRDTFSFAIESGSESRSVMFDSLGPDGLYSPWNSPGQNTGVGSLSLLQGIFPTQRSNPGLPHCRRILYQLSHSWLVFIKHSFYLPFQIYWILVNSFSKLLYQVIPTQWWVYQCRPTSPSTLFVDRCINLCHLLNG